MPQRSGPLFVRLCEMAAQLPRAVLMEINRLAQRQPSGRWPTSSARRCRSARRPACCRRGAPSGPLSLEQLAPNSPLLQADPLRRAARAPASIREPIDVAELAAMLRPGGAFSRAFPGYEFRPPQVHMLESVAGAFNQSHHLMAEAGTGTGKSLAYLLPAIAYAVKNGTRVVVSTNTINLQDQLFKKDLPDLQRILSDAWNTPTPFRAALLKGRSNYLCPRRFAALKARPSLSDEELGMVARILVWLPEPRPPATRASCRCRGPPIASSGARSAAENEGCSLDRCQREMGGRCFFYRARRQAEAAHVVVVNHALLMADAATENRVLPEYPSSDRRRGAPPGGRGHRSAQLHGRQPVAQPDALQPLYPIGAARRTAQAPPGRRGALGASWPSTASDDSRSQSRAQTPRPRS